MDRARAHDHAEAGGVLPDSGNYGCRCLNIRALPWHLHESRGLQGLLPSDGARVLHLLWCEASPNLKLSSPSPCHPSLSDETQHQVPSFLIQT